MTTMASQITSLTIVYSIVYSNADQRKYQSSALLAFVRGIYQWPVNSPHKGSVTRKMSPVDDVIIVDRWYLVAWHMYSYIDFHHFWWSKTLQRHLTRIDKIHAYNTTLLYISQYDYHIDLIMHHIILLCQEYSLNKIDILLFVSLW